MRSNKLLLGGLLLATILVFASVKAESKNEKGKQTKIVLSKDNVINMNDEVNGDSVSEVITKAKVLDTDNSTSTNLKKRVGISVDKKPIYLFLRTPGGNIQSGIEMFEALKGLNRPVDTVTIFAASMGFQTVQALGKRYIVQGGVLMSHRASGGFEGSFGGKKGSPLDNRKHLWEQRIQEMDQLTADRSGGKQTLESYQAAYAEELWLTGKEAVEQGYADELVTISCDDTLSGVEHKAITYMGVPVTYDVSQCPLDSNVRNVQVGLLTTKGKMKINDFLSQGGEFGSACLQASGVNPNKVCAIDSTLTIEKISSIETEFRKYYSDIKNRVVPTVIP